jgi:hypothetical protein
MPDRRACAISAAICSTACHAHSPQERLCSLIDSRIGFGVLPQKL